MNATSRLKIARLHQAARVRVAQALAVAFGIAVAALPLPAHAQFTWTGGGANGTWSTTGNWGASITPPATNFNSAFVFGGTTGTNSFNDRTGGTITDLTFNAGAGPFTLSGNSVAIGGSPTWTNNSSNTQNVALPLTMTSGQSVTKAGSGNLVLSGNISLTGTATDGGHTFISNSGTFTIGGNVSLPTSGTGAGGLFGRFGVRGDGAGVVSGVISGGVTGVTTVVRSSVGTGEWVFSGNNTYLGNTLVNGGTLTLSGASTISGTTTLNAARLNINNGGSGGTSSALGTSRLVINNAGASLGNSSGSLVTLSTNNEQTWNTDFSFVGPNSLNLGTGAVTLTASPTVSGSAGAASLIVGGPISGSFGLTKAGPSPLILSGSNTYTGSTIVNAGTLQIGNAGTTGALATTSAITGSAGGTLAFGRTDTVTQGTHFNSVIGGAINLTQAGSGTLVLNGANTYTGTTSISAGTLRLDNSAALQNSTFAGGAGSLSFGSVTTGTFGGLVGSSNLTLSNTAGSAVALAVGGNNSSTTYSGALSGGGSLTKLGAGTLTLSASNSYSGATSINAGTLSLTGSGALATTGAVNVAASGAAFDISGITATGLTIGSLAGAAGSVVTTGGKNLTVGDATSTTFAGNITGTTSAGTSFTKVGSGTLTISGNWNLGVNGQSSDNGAIAATGGEIRQTAGTVNLRRNNPNGSGAFLLGGTSSYTVSSGTLLVFNSSGTSNGSSARIGSSATSTATLTINGADARVRLGGTDNTLGGNNGSSTGGGASSGTGTINLMAGELAVNSLTTGTVAGSTGTFNFSGGTLRPYSQNTSIGRSGSGFTIALAGTSATFSGLDAATGTSRTLTILTTLVNGTSGAANAIFSGGTVSLSAANTYSGATTIAGTNTTLVLGSSGSFANSPTIRVGNAGSSGAILDLTSKTGTFSFTSGQTVGGIGTINIGSGKTVSSAGLWAPGNSIGSNAVTGNLSLSGTSQFELGTPGTSTSAPGTSDFTAVSGTLTLGGSLTLLDNAGADGNGSVGGGVYRLFTYSAVSGSYASVTTNPSATTVTGLGNISYGGSGTSAGQGVFLTVYDRAVASFGSGPTALTTLTLDFLSVNQGDSVSPQNFSLYNLLQTAGFTADLALLSITPGLGNTDALSTNLSLFNSLASGTFNSYQATVNTSNQGTFTNTWTLSFKSSNANAVYSGDSTQTLTLTANVIVVPEPGAIALAGIGIAAAACALRRRRREARTSR